MKKAAIIARQAATPMPLPHAARMIVLLILRASAFWVMIFICSCRLRIVSHPFERFPQGLLAPRDQMIDLRPRLVHRLARFFRAHTIHFRQDEYLTIIPRQAAQGGVKQAIPF